MSKTYGSGLSAAIFLILLAGCGDPLKAPDNANVENSMGGGSTAALVIPGSGGKTTDDIILDTDFNAGLNKPGMRIFPITQGEVSGDEITTQKTLGLWEDGKFHIEGFNASFNGTYANAGFTDVSLLYYDQPFEGEFKISARIRILRTGGVSTGKGIHFGAYSPMGREYTDEATGETLPQFGGGQNSKGMGLFFRAESSPQFRLYYSDQFASTTAGTGPILTELIDLKIGKEYIYEVARSATEYTFSLLDSKTYEAVVWRGNPPQPVALPSLRLDATTHPVGGTTISMHPSLKEAVYAGVCISGSAAEISQIRIWDNASALWDYKANDGAGAGDEPVFATPATVPAYVPANYINQPAFVPLNAPAIDDWGNIRPGNQYIFSGTYFWNQLLNTNHVITVTPSVNPDFADENIRFEFYPMGEPHEAFKKPVEGNPGQYTVIEGDRPYSIPELPGRTGYGRGIITVDPDKLESGQPARANFKIVARDLNLDIPGEKGLDAPDYSLKQTLPEYYFTIEITRP